MAFQMPVGAAGVSPGQTKPIGTVGKTHVFDKTRLCKFWAKGQCNRGEACSFAHGDHELMPQPDFYKTQLCVEFFRLNSCSAGAACRYAHDPLEVRRSRVAKKQRALAPLAPSTSSSSSSSVGAVDQALPSGGGAPAFAPAVAPAVDAGELQSMQTQISHLEAQLEALRAKFPAHGARGESARQLRLQTVSSCQATQKKNSSVPLKMEVGDVHDDVFCGGGLSRQSTEEGCALESAFSRQSTQNCEGWTPVREEASDDEDVACDEDLFAVLVGEAPIGSDIGEEVAGPAEAVLPVEAAPKPVSQSGDEEEEEDQEEEDEGEDLVAYELVVQHSFLSLVPVPAGGRRRSKSTPPEVVAAADEADLWGAM